MNVRDLPRVGHLPSLFAGLLHFEVSFAVWMLLGALAPYIAAETHLAPALKGLLVGTPLLAAALLRPIVGSLADAYGPKRVGLVTMTLTLVPLALAWRGSERTPVLFLVALLLGIAGSSFAIALPLAGAHFPESHRGFAMGIAGAGNSGTIIAAFMAPRFAEKIGWHGTFGLALVPVALAVVGFWLLAREAPGPQVRRRIRDLLQLLRAPDCWRLCGFYSISFGGFVGFASFLPVLLTDSFSVSKPAAGAIAAAAAGAGSFMRPIGGMLADRIGGGRVLVAVFVLGAAAVAATSLAPGPLAAAAGFFVALGALGAGNGAATQLVPMRFPERVGAVIGCIGAAGGLGGFLLPSLLGAVRQMTGSYSIGMLAFSAAGLAGAGAAASIRIRWARSAEVAMEASF